MEQATIDKIRKVVEDMIAKRHVPKGFILMPTDKGFEIYDVDKDRLKLYLKMETLQKKLNEETKVPLIPLNKDHDPNCKFCHGTGWHFTPYFGGGGETKPCVCHIKNLKI